MISKFFRHKQRRAAVPQLGMVQSLEDRTLLSGNVNASVSGGRLLVIGDSANNDIAVEVTQNGGVKIFGHDGTTVNGQGSDAQSGPAFEMLDADIRSIVMNLGEGDDIVDITSEQLVAADGAGNVHLDGLLWVDLAGGNDDFYAYNIDFAISATVYGRDGHDSIDFYKSGYGVGHFDGGAGDDGVYLSDVHADYGTTVWSGAGNDVADVYNSVLGGRLSLFGNEGNDGLYVTDTHIGGFLFAAGGTGNDMVSIVNSQIDGYAGIYGGLGMDDLSITDSHVGQFLWMTGSEGNDSLVALRTLVEQLVAMYGQGGDDYIDFNDSSAYYVHLNGGFGADDVRSTGSTSMTNMTLYTGFGDDLASVEDSDINGFLLWNGGWGHDGFGMAGTHVGGAFFAYGLFGNDLLGVTSSTIGGVSVINMGMNDDAVVLSDTNGGANTFGGRVSLNLGLGDDVVQVNGVHRFGAGITLLGSLGRDRTNIMQEQDVTGSVLVFGIETENDATVRDRVDAMLDALATIFPNFNTSPLASLFTVIFGDNPQIVLIIDVSGSTSARFDGTPVGDLNNDGLSDTILDAEIAAAIAFNDEFTAANLGGSSSISVVVFGSSAAAIDLDPVTPGVQKAIAPDADMNGNGIPDFNEAVMALLEGANGVGSGSTNFEAALQETITTFGEVQTPDGDANVIFLSDGEQNAGGAFDDEVADLNADGAKLIAFGVGQQAVLAQLQVIDPDAEIVDSTDDFIDSLASLI